MSTITIYHNPKCGTSRNVLALIRHTGVEPEVIEYLQTPPSVEKLTELLTQMKKRPQDILRKNVEPFTRLESEIAQANDTQLIELMVANPLLINRPIVVTDKGVKLCRPAEEVVELLSNIPHKAFFKEDGTQVLNDNGELCL